MIFSSRSTKPKNSLLKIRLLPLRKRRVQITKKGRNGLKPKRIKSRKVPKNTDAWIKAIPVSAKAHGSGHLQKRLWRLTSDYVRIRDAHKYGKCVATNQILTNWNEGQAGHYRSYTSCNGLFKFDTRNIHLQTARSNAWPNSNTYETFQNNLRIRYGMARIDEIDQANRNTPLKITTDMVLREMRILLMGIAGLPEQPPYYARVMTLLATQQTTQNVNGDKPQTPIE